MAEAKNDGKSVNVDAVKEFIDGFANLSRENQLVLLGMLKGMVAVNDVKNINKTA